MARRKKGRAVHGWVVVDKPEGVTSTQVVGRVRWAFDAQKAGHAGTLDPLATGLLAVALGEATKTVPYAQDGLKTYQFTARWGQATTTDDREGEVCATSDLRPDQTAIENILPQFVGDIMQTPPIYSAIKVDGERAYDLARAGEDVALKARPLWMESLRLIDMPDADHARFEMVCGKGGYVRSLARDLGEALGCRAHVATLRRVSSGGFDVDGALQWDQIEPLRDDPARDAHIAPVEAGLSELPSFEVNEDAATRIYHGDSRAAPALRSDAYWLSFQGRPLAVAERDNGGPPRLQRVFRFDEG
ncbi:MAG: tRNA pseudouridine(55) synthase TruB [Pikeienuella sp.]